MPFNTKYNPVSGFFEKYFTILSDTNVYVANR